MLEVNSLHETYQMTFFFFDMKILKSSLKVDFYFHNLRMSGKAKFADLQVH